MLLIFQLLPRQAFDAQVVGDGFFESGSELFKVLLQDYREAFRLPSAAKTDQSFFWFGQMLDFFHRLLRRIISRESLPVEKDWDALLVFDVTDVELLFVSHFMEKTEFGTKAIRAARGRIEVETEKKKKEED